MEDRNRFRFSGQTIPSCSKVSFYNKDDESVVFKVNLLGPLKNQVKVANLLTVFKADMVILEDGSILETDEEGYSIDTFTASASYGVTIVAQKHKNSGILEASSSYTAKQIVNQTDKVFVEADTKKGGEEMEKLSEYEKLRNERVAFNQKKMLELLPGITNPPPGKKKVSCPTLLPVKRVLPIAPIVLSKANTCLVASAEQGKKLLPASSTVKNFNQEDLYQRIFKQRPKGTKGKLLWGRNYLREHFPLQWKTYNQNVKIVRSWFSNVDDPISLAFMRSNLRNQKVMVEEIKEFIRARELALASLLFMSNGTVLHVRWQVDDIYEWFKGYKLYCIGKGKDQIHMDEDAVEALALANDVEVEEPLKNRGNFEQEESNMLGFNNVVDFPTSQNSCFINELHQEPRAHVNQTNEENSHIQFTELNNNGPQECLLKEKRKRVASLKAVESQYIEQGKIPKQKMRKGEVEKLMESTLLEAETSIVQGIQLKTLSENSKKTLAMVLMDLERVHEVLPNISGFASKTFPQLGIKIKKDDPDQGKKRLKHLDLVVVWALKEFKVGITNPPPLKNGIQQLYVENIKKLS